MNRVHVIGAGVAGLATAVSLTRAGRAVVLYEASGQAGGRCRSYVDAKLACTIDNGNHLLLSGNQAAMRYLADIGASQELHGPPSARFPFLDLATGERWCLQPNGGRLPWWLLSPGRRVPWYENLELSVCPAVRGGRKPHGHRLRRGGQRPVQAFLGTACRRGTEHAGPNGCSPSALAGVPGHVRERGGSVPAAGGQDGTVGCLRGTGAGTVAKIRRHTPVRRPTGADPVRGRASAATGIWRCVGAARRWRQGSPRTASRCNRRLVAGADRPRGEPCHRQCAFCALGTRRASRHVAISRSDRGHRAVAVRPGQRGLDHHQCRRYRCRGLGRGNRAEDLERRCRGTGPRPAYDSDLQGDQGATRHVRPDSGGSAAPPENPKRARQRVPGRGLDRHGPPGNDRRSHPVGLLGGAGPWSAVADPPAKPASPRLRGRIAPGGLRRPDSLRRLPSRRRQPEAPSPTHEPSQGDRP